VIPVAILPDQIGAVSQLRRRPRPQPGGGFGEGFGLGSQYLLQDSPLFGLSGTPGPRGSLLEGLDEAIIEAPDEKLTHGTLLRCYQFSIAP
jgi:hypothetical protein